MFEKRTKYIDTHFKVSSDQFKKWSAITEPKSSQVAAAKPASSLVAADPASAPVDTHFRVDTIPKENGISYG
jgi:hypothetical protein